MVMDTVCWLLILVNVGNSITVSALTKQESSELIGCCLIRFDGLGISGEKNRKLFEEFFVFAMAFAFQCWPDIWEAFLPKLAVENKRNCALNMRPFIFTNRRMYLMGVAGHMALFLFSV